MENLQTEIGWTKNGLVVKYLGCEIARMYSKVSNKNKGQYDHRRTLVLEVDDAGDANFDFVLAVFKHARAFGGLPRVD